MNENENHNRLISETQPDSAHIDNSVSTFAKKGFLLDRESIKFLLDLENLALAEEILNKLLAITKSRVISKKIINEHFEELKSCLTSASKEKDALIQDFFQPSLSIKPKIKTEVKPAAPLAIGYNPHIKILSSNIIPYRKIAVTDFVTHFRNRYNFFKDLLRNRKELDGLVSINKIGGNRNFSIIGLVSDKRITKNKNIILEVEDLTGKAKVLIGKDKEPLIKKAKEILMDDVIGLKCSGNGEFIYANEVLFPDSIVSEKKKSDKECYALFSSDMHVGSKFFLKENFMRFIRWLNGEGVDDATREKISKIKYLFLVGDNVDGVGIYPGQEALLETKDMKEQYKRLAEYFKMMPEHINIIMCPGQHDAVRVPEPQPAIDEEFAKEITDMKRVFLVSNPALVEVDCDTCGKKSGFKVLMYHGASMFRGWIDEIEDLRLGKAHLNPTKVIKYMLRHRHLSPTHSGNVYVPSEKEDMLAIKDVPDIVVTGDLHKSDVDLYNNILLISGSCWQSATPYEEKVGNQPDPCKVPMLNLKTREIKILDFS